jgi:hypothetical protein
MKESFCINCGQPVSTSFCPECGQQVRIPGLTWKVLMKDFAHRWIGFDNQFGRTAKDMVLKPAYVVEEYWKGNRVRYISPLAYLVVMSALFLLSFDLFGVDKAGFIGKTQETFQGTIETQDQQAFVQGMIQTFSQNMRLLAGLMIPFMALGIALVYKSTSYLKGIVIATFITSELLWMSLVSVAVAGIFGKMLLMPQILLTLAYYAWTLESLHRKGNRVLGWLKGLWAYLAGYVAFMLLIVVVTVVYVVVTKLL